MYTNTTTHSPAAFPAYERVLIRRSAAGLPRTYRLVRKAGRATLLQAVLRVIR